MGAAELEDWVLRLQSYTLYLTDTREWVSPATTTVPNSIVASVETHGVLSGKIGDESWALRMSTDEAAFSSNRSSLPETDTGLENNEARKSLSNSKTGGDTCELELCKRTGSDVGGWLNSPVLPANIDLAAVEQLQMFNSFLNLHFRGAEASQAQRCSYMLALPDADLYTSPMLSDAVNAISYCHLGAYCNDDRLIHRSQMCYGKVLLALSRLVDRPGSHSGITTRIIITTIMTLCFYDSSLQAASPVADDTWKMHYKGVNEYLEAKGPSALRLRTDSDILLFRNLRMSTPFLHLATRRAIAWTGPQWVKLKDATFTASDPLRRLIAGRMAYIPALLERSDQVVIRPSQQNTTQQLLHDLLDMISSLQRWHKSDPHVRNSRWETVNVSQYTEFDHGVEEHVVLSLNDTFRYFYKDHTEVFEHGDMLYWLSNLIVDCTILRVLHFSPSPEIYLALTSQPLVLRRAQDNAHHLCRSVYALSKFPSQGVAGFLDACMSLVENFFCEIGATRELGWVLAIRCATALRVKRLRQTQPRTLCRMGDVADGIGAAGRFRTRAIVPKD